MNKLFEKMYFIAKVVIYLPLWGAAWLMPRNSNRWIFTSNGSFSDNSKYLYLQAYSRFQDKQLIWLALSKEEREDVRQRGFCSYSQKSLKGIYYCLTAGIGFFSYNIMNGCLFSGAKRIVLWHGVGLKKMGLLIEPRPKQSLYKRLTEVPPSLFLVTSPFIEIFFSACFGLSSNQLLRGSYPRNMFVNLPHSEVIGFVEKQDPLLFDFISQIERFDDVYLYMPTWRDDRSDFIAYAKFDFERINEILMHTNSLLILKLHILTKIDIEKVNSYSNIVVLNQKTDIYPLLPFISTLITDYSSVYYDFILQINKKVILFPFDYEEYTMGCRGLSYDYNEYTPGVKAYSFDDLLDILKQRRGTSTNDIEIRKIANLFWEYTDSVLEQFV